MTIAQAGKRVGLTTDTLRYYERAGLIPEIGRTTGGIRDYTENDCAWIEFIKCMRDAGVQVESLAEYVRLFQEGDGNVEERRQILIRERERVATAVDAMQAVLARLDRKIEKYDTDLREAEIELRAAAKL